MISYKNLWKTLIDQGMKRTDLIAKAGISSSTLANMGKNQSVNLETIERVCDALDCDISDVVTFENDKTTAKENAKVQDAAEEKELTPV